MSKAVYLRDMESGGMVRCAECGYKNSPVYHYCGVCGAVLHPAPAEPVKAAAPAGTAKTADMPAPAQPAPADQPTPAAPPPASVAPPAPRAPTMPPPPSPFRPEPPMRREASAPQDSSLSGMSFLGLSQPSSSSSANYLLDDEEPGRRTWGRFVFIVLLLAVGGGLAWQWKHGGYPFAKPQQTAVAPAQPAQNPAPTTPETAPLTANTPLITAADTPSNQPVTPEPTPAQPAATEPAKPAEAKSETPAETTPPETKPAETKPAETKPKTPEPTVAKAQPPITKPVPAEPAISPGESLFRQGQKYLYGTGVPANCDLAQKSLMAAAARNHAQAQSTLGTMYFTGHCVNRDLPSAYRWFARALKQDPSNSRLEQNLNVVWRQMTAEERQVAMQAQ